MSNFDFLDGCSEVELYEHSRELEKCYVLGMYSLMPNISRQYIESFYEELKSNERIFLPSYLNNKSGFDLNKKTEYFEKEVKDFCSISEYCATLISIGHVGSHNNKKNVDERKALEILKFTHRLSEWFFKKYYDVNDETFNFVVPSHVNIEEVINENKDLKNRVNSQQEKIQSIIKERDNLVLNNETLAKQNDFLSKSEQKIDKKKIDSLIVELAQSYKVEINRLQEKLEKEQKENINYHSQCDILKREIEEKTVSLKNKENILKHNQKLENINDITSQIYN